MMYGEGRKAPPLLFWPGASEASRFGLLLPGLRPRRADASAAGRAGTHPGVPPPDSGACLRRMLPPNERAAALSLPGLPGPDPGNFLYAQKVTKKAPGDPDPLFIQSDACKAALRSH